MTPNRFTRGQALALLAAGCARPALAQATAVVRIGTNPIDPFGESYYGLERGFFKDAGIDAQLTVLPNGSTITQAVLANDLDVGIANIVQVAAAVAKGLPVQMIAPAALYSAKHAYSALCVAKTSPLRRAQELEGATIAVSTLNDFNQLGVTAWLEHNGVAVSRVRFIELKFPEMGPALARGTIAAATIAEPALTTALHAGQARIFATPYSVIAPEFVAIVWFSSKDWLAKNGALAKRLVGAIYTTARWANDHPAESGAIMAREAKLDPAIVGSMQRAYYAPSFDPSEVAAPLDFAAKYGLIAHPITTTEFVAAI